MAWLWLGIAGILEIVWAFALKQSAGFTRPWPSAVAAVTMIGSIVLLGAALRVLPLGTAYAVWTGIGTLGAFAVGVILLGETTDALRLVSAGLILLGLIGLRLGSSAT